MKRENNAPAIKHQLGTGRGEFLERLNGDDTVLCLWVRNSTWDGNSYWCNGNIYDIYEDTDRIACLLLESSDGAKYVMTIDEAIKDTKSWYKDETEYRQDCIEAYIRDNGVIYKSCPIAEGRQTYDAYEDFNANDEMAFMGEYELMRQAVEMDGRGIVGGQYVLEFGEWQVTEYEGDEVLKIIKNLRRNGHSERAYDGYTGMDASAERVRSLMHGYNKHFLKQLKAA